MANTYYCWMGWTRFESSYPYPDARALYVNGDSGRAYGMYQFDYRWGLIPFMQSCVAYDSVYYAGFNPYIALGAGNSQLIGNSGLVALFQRYATERLDEFQYLQDVQGVETYLEPLLNAVQTNYGYDLAEKGLYVLGSAFSMAIRSGYNPAYTFFGNGYAMTEDELLRECYAKQGQLYYDAGRWQSGGSYSQYDAVFADKANNANIFVIPYGGSPPPHPTTKKKGMPIWMMIKRF